MREYRFNLVLKPSLISGVLLTVAIFFASAYLLLNYINLNFFEVHWLTLQLFDLDDENNLPTWFASFLLTICAGLNWQRAQASGSFHWAVLACGMFVLAIDEVAGLHETLNTVIEINWAIPAAVLVAVAVALMSPFLWQLDAALRVPLILAGLLFVSGAVGVELLSEDMDEESYQYMLAVTLEESLEMLGAWLYLNTLLRQNVN